MVGSVMMKIKYIRLRTTFIKNISFETASCRMGRIKKSKKTKSIMTEIFRTNVKHENDAERIIFLLKLKHKKLKVNFDLEDCDSILRVENRNGNIPVISIINILQKNYFLCEVLPD